ncbi:MAG TPA: ribonuclease E/G [Rhodospirillaceae bacterium]|nr:ribonuclease E/G [Rhodospirillaceae bacterium]
MTKRMLVDATHPEETRIAIVESYRDNNRLEDLDFSLASKPILRGNIYLAKVMRIEPSLQAAFVEYGGNRHGFLPFSEIHPDYFRIPVADRPAGEDVSEDEDMEEDENENGENEEGHDGHLDESVPDDDDKDYTQSPDHSEETNGEGETPSPEEPQEVPQEEPQEQPQEQPEPQEPKPEDGTPAPVATRSLPHGFGDEDTSVGLITDFGNAAVGGSLTEVAMPEAPPESVGGEVTERIVRQHRPRYKIQEVLKRGQVMLIQVVKEERGNKGAALTSFLSLAGRYCVLMPNTDHGGGVSRKITNHQDRRRMKEILDQLEIPEGMAVILRTAGMEQAPPDIQRDLEYLLSMWDSIREQTLQSSAPSLIYEEANLIKRSVRDLYSQDIAEILIAGQDAYQRAHDFMRAIMPDQADKIKHYTDPTPLFIRYQVENQIDSLHSPIVQLRSGGYLVINPTEALVSIDVNSGRATRERHIEETALKTNLEAAEEIARQLRLRDLAGLVVIDFIDMEDGRNNAAVERRIKESMKNDRARLQIGRISPFGLLELSRQRLRPSLLEISFEKCPHCLGTGNVRSPDSAALSVLRAIEEEAIKQRTNEITATVAMHVAVYILNHKRADLGDLETRYGITIVIQTEEMLPPPGYKLDRAKGRPSGTRHIGPAVNADQVIADTERDMPDFARDMSSGDDQDDQSPSSSSSGEGEDGQSSRRGRGRFRKHDRGGRQSRRGERGGERGGERTNEGRAPSAAAPAGEDFAPRGDAPEGSSLDLGSDLQGASPEGNGDQDNNRRRRRGRRGGRRRHGERGEVQPAGEPNGNQGGEWAPRAQQAQPSEGAPRQSDNAPRQARPATPRAEVPYIPASIHDLDTTPKPASQDPRPASSSVSRSYETVNPPSDQPKGGWWRKLTGQ